MGCDVHMNTNPQYRGTQACSDPVAMLNPPQVPQNKMTVLGDLFHYREWDVLCTGLSLQVIQRATTLS